MGAVPNAPTPGLPKLRGSPKQVAWAGRIRARLLRAYPNPDTLAALARRSDAGFWIEHRTASYAMIIADSYAVPLVSGPFTALYPRYDRDDARETLAQLSATRYLVLDCETTGLAPKKHEIIELAVIDGATGRALFDSLLRPHDPWAYEHAQNVSALTGAAPTSVITGITPAMLADAPTLPEVWMGLREMLQSAHLTTFNASFDIPFIRASTGRWGLDVPPLPATCIMRLVTAYCDRDTWLSLAEAAELLGIERGAYGAAHRAAADARLAADVLRKMLQEAGYEP